MPDPQLYLCRPFIFGIVGRGALTPPRGVGDAAPYSGDPQTFS